VTPATARAGEEGGAGGGEKVPARRHPRILQREACPCSTRMWWTMAQRSLSVRKEKGGISVPWTPLVTIHIRSPSVRAAVRLEVRSAGGRRREEARKPPPLPSSPWQMAQYDSYSCLPSSSASAWGGMGFPSAFHGVLGTSTDPTARAVPATASTTPSPTAARPRRPP